MRAGETDCAETVDDPGLQVVGRAVSEKLRHIANLDLDVFVAGGRPFILEMNARFGGGYPFSHMAGVNLPLAIVKWLRREDVDASLLTGLTGIIAHKDIEMVQVQI